MDIDTHTTLPGVAVQMSIYSPADSPAHGIPCSTLGYGTERRAVTQISINIQSNDTVEHPLAVASPQHSNPLSSASPDPDIIILPSELLSNGEFSTTYVDIRSMLNEQLLRLIRKWRLKPEKMNKAAYKSALRDFSADRDAWEQRKPGTTRPHKGPSKVRTRASNAAIQSEGRSDAVPGRKRCPKVSVRRQDVMMLDIVKKQTSIPQRSRDMRTVTDPSRMLEWAHNLIARERGADPEAVIALSSDNAAYQGSEKATVQCGQSSPSPGGSHILQPDGPSSAVGGGTCSETATADITDLALPHPLASTLTQILQSMYRLERQMDRTLSSHENAPPTVPMAVQSSSSGSQPSLSSSIMTSSPVDQTTDAHIVLASGTLYFNVREIPDPPFISFAKDLDRLNRMWDDSAPSWDGSSPLIIRGEHIALIHWPQVYRYRRDQRWASIKQRWLTWKFLNIEYQSMTSEAFWDRYSIHGERMGVTKIANLLREARKTRDQNLTTQAKERFGDRFPAVFTYRKGGEAARRVKTKVSSIARSYESLLDKHATPADALQSDDRRMT